MPIPMKGDLFDGWTPPVPPRPRVKKRGHAGQPGDGPLGETCKSCVYYTLKHLAGTYRKCGLVRRFWTSGAATDIKAGDPACPHWMD